MRPGTASKSPSNGPLVSATFSNKKARERSRTKSRGRSRERMPSPILPPPKIIDHEDDIGLDIIRSFSDNEGPDDIFDIQERYSGITAPFSITLIPSLATSEESTGGDGADEGHSNDDEDEEDSFSPSQASFEEHESYLNKIMERFQIKDVMEGLQSTPSKKPAKGQQSIATSDSKTTELKMKLRKEINRTKELEEKLAGVHKRYASQSNENQSKIVSLESKLAQQERMFARQLNEERQKRMQNEDSKKEEQAVAMINAHNEREQVKSLLETVQQLQKENTTLKTTNSSLEALMEERELQFQHFAETTKMQMKDLELQHKETKKNLESQAAKIKKTQLDLNKTQAMLEVEKKRCKTFELSEARAQKLLATERKRIETISEWNERMKTAMRKSSRQVVGHDSNTNDQVDDLRKLLQKRDEQISLIKGILSTQQQVT